MYQNEQNSSIEQNIEQMQYTEMTNGESCTLYPLQNISR